MFEPIGWGMWEGSPYANDYNLKEDVVSASRSEGVPSSKYLPGGHTTLTCGKLNGPNPQDIFNNLNALNYIRKSCRSNPKDIRYL